MSSIKERVKEFLRYLNIGQLAFENETGLSRGFVNKIGYSLNRSSVEKISERYPELNIAWLKTGVGSMLVGGEQEEVDVGRGCLEEDVRNEITAKLVPLLPIVAQGGSLNDFLIAVKESDCEKVITPIKGVDFAININGESMAPEYPSGSQIFIKRINERAFVEWGKVYVLDTCNGVVVKTLVPSNREGYVRCISINSDPIYAPFEIAWEDIHAVYRVLLCMSVK